jgi:hypothetical protein
MPRSSSTALFAIGVNITRAEGGRAKAFGNRPRTREHAAPGPPQSYGNAIGIGMADVTTDRLVREIAWEPTRVNAASAGVPSRIRVPAHFATDRECLQWVAATAGKLDPAHVTYGWILNSLELSRVAISPNLRTLVEGQPHVTVEGECDVPWDSCGNLVSPFLSRGEEQ